MCVDKDKRKESDVLDRPLITDNLDSSLWNDKCDYIEIDNCKDLNPNNYNLVVVQLNIRNLLLKQLELKRLLRDLEVRKSKADMILLCETFLSDATVNLVNIPGYKLYSNHRKNYKGGGTIILVRTDMISKRRSDLTVFQEKEIESTFIEVLAKNGRKL